MNDPSQDDPPPDDPLQATADTVTDPDETAGEAARRALGPDGAYGRLGELAIWWASVTGETAPRRVLLAGGGRDVAARRPGTRALALPRGGSVDDAIRWGLRTADTAADDGTDLVLLCLDDPFSWRAIVAGLLALEPAEACGWPQDRGMSDEQWMDEVTALRDTLRRTRGSGTEPTRFLHALGAPAPAAATALLLESTARRTPVLLDGPGAAAAGLLAMRAHYGVPRWWQVAHLGEDPLHERLLGSLGLEAITRLGTVPEDGTASLAALALLDTALALLAPNDLDGPAGPDGNADHFGGLDPDA